MSTPPDTLNDDEVELAVRIALEMKRQRGQGGPASDELQRQPVNAAEPMAATEDNDLDEEQDQSDLSFFARLNAAGASKIYAFARNKAGAQAGKEHLWLRLMVTMWLCGLLVGLLVGTSA